MSLASRIGKKSLLNKVRNVEDIVSHFKNDMYLGWSGFTGVGGPKLVPTALADHVERMKLNQGGEEMRFNLITGASTDLPIESRWADLKMIKRRTPHQVGKRISSAINRGEILFFDKHLSMTPQDMLYGYYTKPRASSGIDVALVEATEIDETGGLILGPSVGAVPEMVACADKVVIELNTSLPSFKGIHDIDMPVLPPHRAPYMMRNVKDRFGTLSVPIPEEKILAIVESTQRDTVPENAPSDAMSEQIANHLINFFKDEVNAGRLPPNLHPLQSGIGNVANAIVGGLATSDFEHLEVWTEVFQDSFLDFLENGKLDYASSTSVRLTPKGFDRFFKNFDEFKQKIVLRSQQVSNHPELIRRLGCIAMNTPVEIDLYGHANSTCVNGSRMLNGLGGSGDFLRNAKLSVMHTPSTRPSKVDKRGISCIVPFASHIDHTEHDLDVIVTEQGLADLRGLAPRERSRVIVDKCAHPEYRDQLHAYLNLAEQQCAGRAMHEPHSLANAFRMHLNLEKEGTMKLNAW